MTPRSGIGAWLSILGIGEAGVEGLPPAARALLRQARLVVGGERHLALASDLIRGEALPWPRPIADALPAILRRRGEPVAVLASGDPFCFGVGSLLARHLPVAELLCLPAPSAFSLACARLGWAAQDTVQRSVCGRPLAALIPALQPGTRLLLLCADADTPGQVLDLLRQRGFGGSRVWLLEALDGPRERVTVLDGALPARLIDPLNMLAIELVAGPGADVLPLCAGLPDTCFAHDGQLTKREVRAVTLSALQPRRGETLWDVGAGSGSVGIEWMLRDPGNRTVAIEPHPERAGRVAQNALSLGVPELRVVRAAAPEALADLPPPDAVFVGGGGTPGVLQAAWAALRPGGRLVANSVTLDTDAVLFEAEARWGGTLSRLSVERLHRIGGMRGFRPAMTVTQYAACKP